MQSPIYYELYGPDDPAPVPATPPESPLEADLFPFQKSDGTGELLAAQLEAGALAEDLLGGPLSKLREGLFIESDIPAPVNTNTFEQQPLPTPSEAVDSGVKLCECKCERCEKDDHANCRAERKCRVARGQDSHKAVIAGMVGEFRGRLYPHGQSIPRAAWQSLEEAMTRHLTKAIAADVWVS